MAARLVFLAVAALCCIQALHAASLALDTDAVDAAAEVKLATLESQLTAALDKVTEVEKSGYRGIISCSVAVAGAVKSVESVKYLIKGFIGLNEELKAFEASCDEKTTDAERTECIAEAKTFNNYQKLIFISEFPGLFLIPAAEIAAVWTCLSGL